jgi:hypothetical protein
MRSITPTRFSCALLAALATWSLVGCQQLINPWTDETMPPEVVTTSSVAAACAQPTAAPAHMRDYTVVPLLPQDGSVRHFPLWFEDPTEDRGSDDGRFAWTAEDYISAPYGLARMVLNAIAVPISAIVHPPVPLMVSDGVTSRQALGHDHDPEWRPDGATVVPPDLIDLGAVSSAASGPGT